MEWAYGITTVPQRRTTTFPRTLESLTRGGFDKPRLFIDGCDLTTTGHYKETWPHLEMTTREPSVGGYRNWFLTLSEMVMRSPQAHRYAIFQDDIVTVRGLKEYLDSHPFSQGYLNLYLFPSNELLTPKDAVGEKHSGFFLSNQLGRGATGLVFDRAGALNLLSRPLMLNWPLDVEKGHRSIDGAVSEAMNLVGWREYTHYPSLIQHIGTVSVMRHNNVRQPHIPAPSFPGEDFDAMTLVRR